MPKIPVVKARELVRVLEKIGFRKFHQVGSHAQFKNARGLRVTVPIHSSRDLNKKTLKGILRDIGISVPEFIQMFRK